MKQFQYTITDANGIHARPAGLLVKEAQRFASAVKLIRGAEGADEEAAIQALETFFQQNL